MHRFLIFLLVILSFSPINAISNNLSGLDIMTLVYKRDRGSNRIIELDMILINRSNKERHRSIISYENDSEKEKKTMISFLEPADVKGVNFLSWENSETLEENRWLYMPSLRKIKRISGSSKHNSFMGTDFTYVDMGKRLPEDEIHTIISEDEYNGYFCWIIESVPNDKKDIYSKYVSWVDKESKIQVKIDYYNKKGLFKRLFVHEISKVDGYDTVMKTEMINLKKNHKTILNVKNINYNTSIDVDKFQPNLLDKF